VQQAREKQKSQGQRLAQQRHRLRMLQLHAGWRLLPLLSALAALNSARSLRLSAAAALQLPD